MNATQFCVGDAIGVIRTGAGLFAIAKHTESPSLTANGLVGSTANLKECGRTHDFMAAAPIALADALSAGGIMGRGGGQFVGCRVRRTDKV